MLCFARKVQARHLQIDPVLLNSVLSSCGGDHWPRLLSQLDAFRTEWSDWGDWGKRIQRSTVTGNILQNALAKAGFWQLGSSWLAWQQLKPNVVTYSCLMAATTPCPADSWRHAVHLLDVMWAQSIRCNPVALSAAVAVLGERPGASQLNGAAFSSSLMHSLQCSKDCIQAFARITHPFRC